MCKLDKGRGKGIGHTINRYNQISEIHKRGRYHKIVKKLFIKNLMALQAESSSSRVGSLRDAGNDFVVGFDDETRKLVEQLTGGRKQLQIISIVGMAGLGKTTMAKRLLNDPLVVYRFYVRAWSTVTLLPQKKDLLLGIIKSGFNVKDIDDVTSDMELSVMLKRRLSGQRYLIVLDDIWDVEAWNDLKLCFPDDNVGSRVIFTSRLADVPLQAQPGSYQQCLPLLSEERSWDLLRYKVFQKENCPLSLVEIGLEIARKCHGLPLAVVVVAGILANETTSSWWSQVAQDLSSFTGNAPQQYMETLLLSYNHLPNHLKPCFLYFGAFPEDYEIPYRRLILLWMAEGFIKTQSGEDNLEDVAAGYLKDLVDRSLVMVAKRKSDGGIKACIVHDLLRDLCIRKAEEENFMHQLERFEKYVSNFFLDIASRSKAQRLCINSATSHNRITDFFRKPLSSDFQSMLFYSRRRSFTSSQESTRSVFSDISQLTVFRLLRVMDLYCIEVAIFPEEITLLRDLRYIALRTNKVGFPTSISNLQHLQTLKVSSRNQRGTIPKTIWKLVNLRHLILKSYYDVEDPCLKESTFGDGPYLLENLQSISWLTQSKHNEEILKWTPNLRKLELVGNLHPSSTKLPVPNLGILKHLENLSLHNDIDSGMCPMEKRFRGLSSPYTFPVTLKKLTLTRTILHWNEMQKIGMLPNLEVLKLCIHGCFGEQWETNDGGFCRLKHLSLVRIDLVDWSASTEHFPNLQHLKLSACKQLMEIPLGIGDIYSLELIEVRNCNPSVSKSAQKIKEDQESKGNDMLKISIVE